MTTNNNVRFEKSTCKSSISIEDLINLKKPCNLVKYVLYKPRVEELEEFTPKSISLSSASTTVK